MLPPPSLLAALLSTTVGATTLYATHYSGTLNTLNFTGNALTLANSTRTGNTLPSWITYDSAGKALYIADEVFYGASSGNLVSFAIASNGALKATGKGPTAMGVVATTLYGGADGKSFIANAHYQTSQLSTFKLPLTGAQPLQTIKYTMSGPGKIPNRQDAPHPHHVFPDPTGAYLIVPDLGADLIRIHRITPSTGLLTECGTAKPPPGTGPRHGAFHTATTGHTTLLIANELSNSLSAWSVTYPPPTTAGGCISLTLTKTLSPYPSNATAPPGTKVAELHIRDTSVYLSNRNDRKFAGNDSISHFTLSSRGDLECTATTNSYGYYPRTFDISRDGDYVAVGGQTSGTVSIIRRDGVTGRLGALVASLRVGDKGTAESEDGLSAVVWGE